jgi:hypothetical protein
MRHATLQNRKLVVIERGGHRQARHVRKVPRCDIALPYSMTSSARASSVGGTVRPRDRRCTLIQTRLACTRSDDVVVRFANSIKPPSWRRWGVHQQISVLPVRSL